MEEIADILEVIEAICVLNSYTLRDILKLKKKKLATNGAFDKRIVLSR